METQPMSVITHGKISIYVEYYEDNLFSDLEDEIYFAEIKFFWSMDGAVQYIINNAKEGAYILYKCKNGVFCDKDLERID